MRLFWAPMEWAGPGAFEQFSINYDCVKLFSRKSIGLAMSLDAVAQGLRDAINRAILTLERVKAILIDARAKFAVLQHKIS